MSNIMQIVYRLIERVDGEQKGLRLIGYKKATYIKLWLMKYI